MVAPKRKNRFQWKTNYVPAKKKTIKIPVKLLRQIGGNVYKKVIKKKLYKLKNKTAMINKFFKV
jgi:hypothetical protein